MTYAHVAKADVAVWVAASRTTDHAFVGEHLEVLADLNEKYRGQRLFCAVEAALDSEPNPSLIRTPPLFPDCAGST